MPTRVLRYLLFCLCGASSIQSAVAKSYYVATSGDDGDLGTLTEPFASLSHAVEQASPGDTIYLREGRYDEEVLIEDVHGRSGSPITITNYQDERVVFDGTIPLGGNGWSVHSGQIYKTTISTDIYQLFADHHLVAEARWPNSYNVTRPDYGTKGGVAEEGSFWDMESTRAHQADGSTYGHMIVHTEAHNLGATGRDFTGAMLVGFRMPVSGNDVFFEEVTSHTAGDNAFDYSQQTYPDPSGSIPCEQGRFYLTAHLSCLDQPGEWYYNQNNGELYIWIDPDFADTEAVETGTTNPADYEIRGRDKDFKFNIKDSSYLIFDGIEFHASAFYTDNSHHITFDNVVSAYPSKAKLMLKSVEEAETNTLGDGNSIPTYSGNEVLNSEFKYASGRLLRIESQGNRIENSHFHHAAWGRTTFGVISDKKGMDTVYHRNSIHTWGKGNAIKSGERVTISYCRVFNAYYHGDNSGFQIPSGAQEGSVLHHNWIHDCIKRNGVRFDGDTAGIRANMYRIVSLRNGKGYRLKGDQHKIINIAGINNTPDADINIAHDKFYGYDPETGREWDDRILGRRGDFENHGNENSIIRNIAGDLITSDPLPPLDLNRTASANGVAVNAWEGFANASPKFIRDELRDVDNFDFRPIEGSELIDAGSVAPELPAATAGYHGANPDIGPYESNYELDPTLRTYWIPGHQTAQARSPVPYDGSTTVKVNADLIWLEGLDALSHDVYFGLDEAAVANATSASAEFQGNQPNNIFTPTGLLQGTVYYWRIDTVNTDGTVKGELWSFMPGSSSDVQSFNPTMNTWLKPSTGVDSGNHLTDYLQLQGDNSVAYLKFDISAFSGQVQQVLLKFTTIEDPTKLPEKVELRELADNSWIASELHGGNMLSYGDKLGVLNKNFAINTTYSFDVTDYVSTNGGIDGDGVFSFALRETGEAPKFRFHSMTGNVKPELVIVPFVNFPPVFQANTFTLPDAVIGEDYGGNNYSIAWEVNDLDGDMLTFSIAGGPAWASINALTGVISGTPSLADLGSNIWTVQADDGVGDEVAEALMQINVVAVGDDHEVDLNPVGGFYPTEDTWMTPNDVGENQADTFLQLKSSDAVGYLKFDLSSFSGTVERAVLRITTVDRADRLPGQLHFYAVGNFWDAATMSGTDMPETGILLAYAPEDSNQALTANTTYEVDVTSYVSSRGRIRGSGVFSFGIQNSDPQGNKARVQSSEGIVSPEIVITESQPNAFSLWRDGAGLTESNRRRAMDPDGDGMTNEKEFYFGLNPLAVDLLRPVSPTPEASVDYPAWTYRHRNDASVNYLLETSVDLETWMPRAVSVAPAENEFEAIDQSTDGDYTETTLRYNTPTNSLPEQRIFFRVQVSDEN